MAESRRAGAVAEAGVAAAGPGPGPAPGAAGGPPGGPRPTGPCPGTAEGRRPAVDPLSEGPGPNLGPRFEYLASICMFSTSGPKSICSKKIFDLVRFWRLIFCTPLFQCKSTHYFLVPIE